MQCFDWYLLVKMSSCYPQRKQRMVLPTKPLNLPFLNIVLSVEVGYTSGEQKGYGLFFLVGTEAS